MENDQTVKLIIDSISSLKKDMKDDSQELKIDMNRGFDRINGRIDTAHNRIEKVEDDVDILKTHRTKIIMIGTVVVIVVPLVLRYAL